MGNAQRIPRTRSFVIDVQPVGQNGSVASRENGSNPSNPDQVIDLISQQQEQSNNNNNNHQQRNHNNNNHNIDPAPVPRNALFPRGLYFGPQFFVHRQQSAAEANQRRNEVERDNWLGGNNNNNNNGHNNGMARQMSILNSLGGLRPLPQIHQTETVKCPVNINRNSLQLIPVDENNKHKYRIQFMFDCTEPCVAKVYYCVKETNATNAEGETPLGEPTFSCDQQPLATRFERGLNQLFDQPSSEFLDLSLYKDEDLVFNADENYFPVVVVLSTADPSLYQTSPLPSPPLGSLPSAVVGSRSNSTAVPPPKLKLKNRITCQYTFAALIHCADDTYVIKPIRQKIKFSGKSYLVHEIYGLETSTEDSGQETSRECVICMTDSRDTTVLPCRHLCLCAGCAETLRQQSNKCPICRSTVKSMVEIKISKKKTSGSVDDDSDSDKEEALINRKTKKLAPLQNANNNNTSTTASVGTSNNNDSIMVGPG